MTFKYMGLILYGIYFSFCDRKVLHYMVKPLELLFDPLYAKFILKIKKFLKTRYILENLYKLLYFGYEDTKAIYKRRSNQ